MPELLDRLKTALADRYALEHELGAGGMATVYLAEDLKHRRKVAVKVLRPELAAVLGAERFVQEIETTASLQHPHILPLFDSGEANGFLYYVMPFIDGETVRDKLNRETQFGIEEAVKITIEVADALDYAHRNNVIHRDIKPENILLHDGRPMVADFGIALAVSAAAGGRMTETGLSLGTPHYMSPEQATAEKDLTNRSDIYSLGSVLYEMLTGSPPHVGSSAQQIIMKIVTEDVQPVMELRKSVPPNVGAATARALEKLPADRFESGVKFADALTNPVFTFPTTHAAAIGGPTGGRWKRLTPGLGALAAVLLITTVWRWLPLDREAEMTVTRFQVPVPSGIDQTFWGRTSLALAPDGRSVVYSTRGQLYRRSFADFESTPIAGTEGARTPFFSPDGEWVGFTKGNVQLNKVSVSGGPVVPIANADGQLGASWGENDEIIYAAALGTKGLWRMPAGGGAPQRVTTVITHLEAAHMWPQVLPGGDAVLFTVVGPSSGWTDSRIVIQDIGGGTPQTVVRQATFGRYVSGHILYVKDEGAVLAVPFDLAQRRVTGSPIPVLANVPVNAAGGRAFFTVSENGSTAFLLGTSMLSNLLRWVDRTGQDLGQIGTPMPGAFIRLSPDGTHIAMEIRAPGNVDLWWLDAQSGDRERFTFEVEEDETPIWSSDGEQMAYSSAGAGDARNVFVKPVDRSTERQLLYTGQYHIHLTDWSPDDQWVAYYEAHPQNGEDLWLLRADGQADPMPIATTVHNEKDAVFSPDGKWLAYSSNNTGNAEVYVVSFPDLGAEQQVSTNGGTLPRWAPDGDELFYLNGDTLMSSAVSSQAGDLTFGVSRPLFEYPSLFEYDVAPDGQRFVLRTVNPDAMAREIRVVLNWLEELKAKVGNE